MGWPSSATTPTLGTPRREQGVLPVLLNSRPPAREESEPPNWVNSTEADTDDGGQAAAVALALGALVVDEVVGLADGPPEQADSRPSDASARTDATRTDADGGRGTDDRNRVMPASRPTAGDLARARWPDR